MSYIADIPKNTLTVQIERMPDIFVPSNTVIVVRQELGMVILFVGGKRVELNTLTAHRVGLNIAKLVSKLAPDEIVVMTINRERIELLKSVASKVFAALLRKADDADDWQLNRRKMS